MPHSSHSTLNRFNSINRKKAAPQLPSGWRVIKTSIVVRVLAFFSLMIALVVCVTDARVTPTRAHLDSLRPGVGSKPVQDGDRIRNEPDELTPDGRFDTLYDKDGRRYSLRNLRVDLRLPRSGDVLNPLTNCTPGYFQLYFEVNSGVAGTTASEVARRNVLCQVFGDVAAFLPPPAGTPLANGTHRVNIWVRDIGQIISSPQSSGVLGVATAFYAAPSGSTASGIVDNQIWRTINSGTDAYTGLAAPILVQGGQYNSGAGSYYHGMMAFNFSNSGVVWNTNLSTATPSSMLDLYTVTLHEVTHALGFASLINFDGSSKFGSAQYYGRYDLFLQTQAGIKLLAHSGGCSLYNFGWNTALTASSTLSPNSATCGGAVPFSGGNDNTNCATALEYFSSGLATHQKVYTFDCFTGASSLSHFEDACPPTNLGNNSYFVMSNANGAGVTKRYLQPEESTVLCDLGYQVNSNYGSAAVWGSSHTYTSGSCPRIGIAGVNDGISTGGTYTYMGVANTAIPITGFLANDRITTGHVKAFECLEDLYFGGTLSVTSGGSATTVNYTPPAGAQGATVLRYIPINSTTGERGDITYIYVYVTSAGCTPSSCNMINNGGFEANTNCGQIDVDSPTPSVGCWSRFACSPDLFKRNCANPMTPFITIPTPLSSPAGDTWNVLSSNNAFVGFTSYATSYFEGLQTGLNSPMTPGNTYLLSFWAKVLNNNWAFSSSNLPTTVEVGGGTSFLAPVCGSGHTSMPSAFTSLGAVVVPNNNQWNYFTVQITNGNASPISVLALVNAAYLNPSSPSTYVIIDDVSLSPINSAPALSLPTSLCVSGSIPDMSQHAAPANGVFSGPGVSVSGGVYSFNAATAGLGTHTINYTGTNANGCTYNVAANISVVNSGIDLYMKDTMAPELPEDFGVEPTVSQTLFVSSDIWVRNSQASILTSPNPGPDTPLLSDSYYAFEHVHQDPTYYNATTPSYVYAKVRNRGCTPSAGTEKLRLYWAYASTGLTWPGSGAWNEFDCVPGGAVDPCSLPAIAAGQDYVVELPWVPPDPASFGGDHFCLVARVETQPSYPFGMSGPEIPGQWVWQNVAANNNIAWKNITVLVKTGKGKVIVRNALRQKTTLGLRFAVPPRELKDHFLLHGDIFVDLGPVLMKKWRETRQRPRGFELVNATTIRITDPANAGLDGLPFNPGEAHTIEVRLRLKRGDKSRPGTTFNWDVIQMDSGDNGKPRPVGGERYVLKVPVTR